jgi:outer membrane lipoprotein-sorting protein
VGLSRNVTVLIFVLVLGARLSAAAQSPPAPITWSEVAAAYEHVRDYTALYEKEERPINNAERQTIRFFFRKPLDVRMEWLDEKGDVDQTAVYRQGFNQNKLIARSKGILGSVVGTVTLDPSGRMALQDSRHPITEVGIGHIIERVVRETSSDEATSRVVGEEALDGQPSYHVELNATGRASIGGVAGARRVDIWIDREFRLPVKVEVRDAAGTLLERHRFKDVRLNVGLTDKTFTL